MLTEDVFSFLFLFLWTQQSKEREFIGSRLEKEQKQNQHLAYNVLYIHNSPKVTGRTHRKLGSEQIISEDIRNPINLDANGYTVVDPE